MALTAGTKLGPYEILAPIGAGGMGEVYRERDTKLNRDVALKVLPEAFAQDSERMARFEREAQVLASLNHPNIATIHGLEESGGMRALVMELAEGPTLADRIAQGPIPFDEALPIAKQIAEALEFAHQKGIIHRDLKPANVKITPIGNVKLLDFGLAKAMEPVGPSTPGMTHSPTISLAATQAGIIPGTASYLSPEQAKGRPLDSRTDIWAFGVVLFEMSTGQQMFTGETVTDVLAAFVRAEPDWNALPAATPRKLRDLLRRCLRKEPHERLHSIADARIEISEALNEKPIEEERHPTEFPSSMWRQPLIWILLSVCAISVAAALWLWSRPSPQKQVLRLAIPLPPDHELTSAPAISGDGQFVAFTSREATESPRLFIRKLDNFETKVVAGTESASFPFFSPDNRWVAFFAKGKLKKVAVAGGVPVDIADAPDHFGGEDDTIVFVPTLNSGLMRAHADGSKPEKLTTPDAAAGETSHVRPQFLPGDRSVLFTIWGESNGSAVYSMESHNWQVVVRGLGAARYSHSGHLLIGDRAAGLLVGPFDPARPASVCPDLLVLQNVFWMFDDDLTWFDFSKDGHLVYTPGNLGKRSLVWVDREGKVQPLARRVCIPVTLAS